MDECRKQLQEKQEQFDLENEQEVERLKKEIQSVREDCAKLRSVTSSSASVTIYPPSTPSSEGVQSNEASLTGSPDPSQREARNSRDGYEDKTEITGPSESETQEENDGGAETVNEVVKE